MLSKLLSQTAIYGLSATLAKFLNYLLTPFLTRVLSDDVYGEMSYIYAIIPFVNVLLTMGFSSGYFRFAGRMEGALEERRLFTTLWGAVSLFALVFSGFGVLFFPSELTVLMFALILVDNVAAMPLSLLRQQGKALYYTVVNVSGVVVNVALCYYFYTNIEGAAQSPKWVLLANLGASSLSLVMLLPPALKMACRGVSLKILRTVGSYSIPLMVAGVMGVASDFIDRQMLRWILPQDIALSELGIYSAVAKIAALMVIFRQIYTLGAEPFFLQQFQKDDFKRLNAAALKYFLCIGIVIFLCLTLFSDLFGLILGADFREGMNVLPILLFSNLLAGVLVNLSFWYKVANKTSFAIVVTVVGIVISVALNLLCIPLWGYTGAAWARLSAMVVMVVLSYVLGQRYYPIRYEIKAMSLYLGIGLGIFALGYATELLQHNFVRWGCNLVLLTLFCSIFVRKEKLFKLFK
ncbi:MAG: polysaccharide biosynthesis C-terminal domain-containing protein [Rikenellaceae bacterium]